MRMQNDKIQMPNENPMSNCIKVTKDSNHQICDFKFVIHLNFEL